MISGRHQPSLKPDSALRSQVAALRSKAFDLLDEMSRRGFGNHDALKYVLEDMLSAANDLGGVESGLAAIEPDHPLAEPEAPAAEAADALPSTQDAAIVLTLAQTSLPFTSNIWDEAERWLRVFRLHGEVGAALQALGVGEAPLTTTANPDVERTGRPEQRAAEVSARASELARERGSDCVTTLDLLFAVLSVYDRAFERALYVRGTSTADLVERLGEGAPAPAQP